MMHKSYDKHYFIYIQYLGGIRVKDKWTKIKCRNEKHVKKLLFVLFANVFYADFLPGQKHSSEYLTEPGKFYELGNGYVIVGK